MDSFDFILQNSETAQQHENITIMAWIHSNLFKNNDNDCYMSSKDLHYQFKLEKQFQNIQSIVIQVSGNHVKKYEMFKLNDDGRAQLFDCQKKPGTVHGCCSKNEFYCKGNYLFHDIDLNVTDFMDSNKNLLMNHDASYDENIACLDGMNDPMDVDENVTFIYPKKMISKFKAKAKNFDVEIMAFVVGYKDNNVLTATELIYPKQTGTKTYVTDEGKQYHLYILKYFIYYYMIFIVKRRYTF